MVEKVLKRDGEYEPFIKEKIIVSALNAGLSLEKARKVALDIEDTFDKKEKVRTSEIKKKLFKYMSQDRKIPEKTPDELMAKIEETEEHLEEDVVEFGSSEIILIALEDLDRFNQLSRNISQKENVKIREVNEVDSKIVVEIQVFSPSQTLI
ncbi:MAG: ATP cone domain containing protein [Candidatus Methanohalarchaeum thermophilum]|uniref:ATP cone domain containing protein n=1 Tax=Methanohalarchaeum thermophilum TaxID=1903181 RepID=A0A1Q6DSC9_METT1|nr:MAG: ATP cone domain containing protein [Candidatus Methanohalarchaeum thermophilum]